MSIDYAQPIDVETSAELRRLAEQVQQTGQPVPLTRGGEIIAVVAPAPAGGKRTSSPPADPSSEPPARPAPAGRHANDHQGHGAVTPT